MRIRCWWHSKHWVENSRVSWSWSGKYFECVSFVFSMHRSDVCVVYISLRYFDFDVCAVCARFVY